MKQKSIFLLALCALLLLGSIGCGEKPAVTPAITVPVLDPVTILSSAGNGDPGLAFNITAKELVNAFHSYSKDKDVLSLENPDYLSASEDVPFDSIAYPLIDASSIVFMSLPGDTKVNNILVFLAMDGKGRKTGDAFIRFLLEVIEPAKKEMLEEKLDLDTDYEQHVSLNDGDNCTILYTRTETNCIFLITPAK